MKLHLLTKNTVQEFDASLPSNEDIISVYNFEHDECICFDEAVNADVVAYGFLNGLIKIFFKNREQRFIRIGVGIIGLKFSNDGTYLSVLKQEGGRVVLHIIEIQHFIPVFTHVLLYSANEIKYYYLSNTTFYYIVHNEFTGTILHQIKFPYQFLTIIPGVRIPNISSVHFHDDHIFSFDPETMCLKKYNEYHTNSVTHVSSTIQSYPLRIASCNQNLWCICENGVYVFDVQNLELRASLINVAQPNNIDVIMSYGNTCFYASKINAGNTLELVTLTYNHSNEISKTLTRRFVIDEVSTILLRDSDFSYITTTSTYPIIVNHSGFTVLIPGINYDQVQVQIPQQDVADPSEFYDTDNESEESDGESEEEEYVNVLQQSLIHYQSKSGLQRVIDFIRSSILHHAFWSNVQQFGTNEWSYIKSCIKKKKIYLFDLSIETHQRIIHDTEHIIDNILKKERASFSRFFNVSETIGEFDGGLSTDLDHENFDANVIETIRVSSGEKMSFSESDLLLSNYVPICNLTHANLLKTLFDEIDSNQEIMNCVTTGIMPTFNILIAQLQDFILEIRIHINKLEKMRTWFREQEDAKNVEPKRKHARIV